MSEEGNNYSFDDASNSSLHDSENMENSIKDSENLDKLNEDTLENETLENYEETTNDNLISENNKDESDIDEGNIGSEKEFQSKDEEILKENSNHENYEMEMQNENNDDDDNENNNEDDDDDDNETIEKGESEDDHNSNIDKSNYDDSGNEKVDSESEVIEDDKPEEGTSETLNCSSNEAEEDKSEEKDKPEKDSIYNVEDLKISDPNNSFMDRDANKENEGENKINKRRSDEGLEIRDELDFEEEKESGEEGEESDVEKENSQKEPVNKEEGELTDEDEDDSLLRQEPKTVCRFFNKGQCTWGTNCRFLHPGVSDKGNYNMFAAPKPQNQAEKEENSPDKEKPREVRRYIPEPLGFESAWERGLRHAKEMMKRANKRKETDADFEEKRFNLSLGQAELDRENDYYTRPASPVYKPSDEVIEYLDPYEKQAIRHFRGGHFENFEVRYKVDPAYPNRGPEHMRSRRDKFEREVTERVPRRMRAASPVVDEPQKAVKEKRYPRPRTWKEERAQEAPPITVGKEAEVWADPWARRKTPVKRTKKVSRNRSYSSGSSSRSSRSSRSSSYSSYSRSGSRSTSRSRSSRSSSRSITPPIHPRQQRAFMNRGGMRGGRGRGNDRGGRGGGPPRNMYQNQQQYGQAPNPPPNHPLAPDVNFQRHSGPGMANRRGKGKDMRDTRMPMQFKEEPKSKQSEPRERIANPKSESRNVQVEQVDRVDMFGRTIRKDVVRSPSKSPPTRSSRAHGRRKFSLSPSRSRSISGSRSRSSSSSGSGSRSRSRSMSRSVSRSGTRSRSSSASSMTPPPPSPISKRKAVKDTVKGDKARKPGSGTVTYGESNKSKAMDLVKVAGQKQQIKLTLKKPGAVKPIDKTVLDVDDDSGESDTDARILKKRKIDSLPSNPPPSKKKAVSPSPLPTTVTAPTNLASKKPSAARREELLKQLRAVEDAIARKRSKPL